MIVRCLGCAGALRWDPTLQKLKCRHCENIYDVQAFDKDDSPKQSMKCSIYGCTACGAKLAVGEIEASTFCAYCGQPTVLYERVADILRPDQIIPFKVSKDEAEKSIRSKFAKGMFVPKRIKTFEVERISGIYVPFRVYNVEYKDTQVIEVRNSTKCIYPVFMRIGMMYSRRKPMS